MAIYPYKCEKCGREEEVVQSISSYSKAPLRPVCHGEMRRVFTVPMIAPDYQQPFVSHLDGSVISSRSEQHEHMKKHGVVLYDDIASDIPRRKEEVLKAALSGIKDDAAEAFLKVEQGYKPQIGMASGSVKDPDVVNLAGA